MWCYLGLNSGKIPIGVLFKEETDMDKDISNFTQNRELSWLRFNQRVLQEAQDNTVPLLERMKFVSIFTSNLDEFFMIRVGSIYDMEMLGDKETDNRSGMSAQEQLNMIYNTVAPLYKERDKTYATIKKELNPYGICGLDFKELEQKEKPRNLEIIIIIIASVAYRAEQVQALVKLLLHSSWYSLHHHLYSLVSLSSTTASSKSSSSSSSSSYFYSLPRIAYLRNDGNDTKER